MIEVIGTCSKCGGAVCSQTSFMGTIPPVPVCLSCGARKKNPFGPVIEVEDDGDDRQLLNE
jgi:hypothetical protein